MAILIAFAFVSGIITILSPCILPVLPIVLSGSVGGGKARPFGVLAGFVASFTAFTLTLTAIVQAIGISADVLRYVAVALIVAFGLVMLVPKLRDAFELLASKLERFGGSRATAAKTRPGFWSGVPIGLGLGLVWTPCVGPIMASVISLAITQRVDGGSVFITLAYTLGTSIPMLAVMLGGRALMNRVPALSRNAARIQQGFGVLMIIVGIAIGLGWDRRFQNAVLRVLPNYGTGLTAIENVAPVKNALKSRETPASGQTGAAAAGAFTGQPAAGVFAGAQEEPSKGVLGDYGLAPDFITDGMWFNTAGLLTTTAKLATAPGAGAGATASSGEAMDPPLSIADLRGRVVVVDFWTYSCVNCVRTIPYLKTWYDAYRSRGLVIAMTLTIAGLLMGA